MREHGLIWVGTLMSMALAQSALAFSIGSEKDSGHILQAARSARDSGDFARAGELYVSAIHDLESAGVADARLATMLLGLGGLRVMEGRCMDAAGLTLRGIRILEATPDPDAHARSEAWATLGRADHCQRQYSKAEAAYGRAIEIERSAAAPRPDVLIEFMSSQGAVQELEHKYADAESAFERARAVLNQHPELDPNEGALVENNVGFLLRLMSRNEEAEAAFRRGLAMAESAPAPDRGLEVLLHYNLASLAVTRKQYREAAEFFSQAVGMMDGAASLSARAAGEILRDYAKCERKLGDRRQAQSLEARAAALLQGQQDGEVVDVTELARKG